MRCCDVATWWSHRKNHQVLTCDFLFLIMRLLTHFNWPYKVGRTSTTNNKYSQKMRSPMKRSRCEGTGPILGRPGLGITVRSPNLIYRPVIRTANVLTYGQSVAICPPCYLEPLYNISTRTLAIKTHILTFSPVIERYLPGIAVI